ncbi:ELMO domain-containing protein 1, partial [Lobosporangium transversale]
MPPPDNLNGALASVKYHVQQWINLVLYNSIYQNVIFLFLYRLFKFLYGLLTRSTELSRICGANDWKTPLDPLWDHEGNVMSNLVNEKHLGTIAFTNIAGPNAFPAHMHLRAAVRATGTTTAPTRTSTDSDRSSSSHSSHDSGSDNHSPDRQTAARVSSSSLSTTVTTTSDGATLLGEGDTTTCNASGVTGTSELKHRKKRSVSSTSSRSSSSNGNINGNGNIYNGNSNCTMMDLRQSRSAAGMIYRIDRCILFSKQLTVRRWTCIIVLSNEREETLFVFLLTLIHANFYYTSISSWGEQLERRELEQENSDAAQITQLILRKKHFPDSGSPHTLAAKKLQYALEKIALTHQLAREINQRAHTKYDSTNPAHERKLMLLWELLRPQEKLDGRYTKQWSEIGFQGKDPATDFRGM